MRQVLDTLNRNELKELGQILEIFMRHLRPERDNMTWVRNFFKEFDPEAVFRWVNWINRIIDRPFPTEEYRIRAHQFGRLIQEKFEEKQISILIQHPLFLYIATFYQIFTHFGLIYIKYASDSTKLGAFLRLDDVLERQLLVDYDAKEMVIHPGASPALEVLTYLEASGVVDFAETKIFQANLDMIPEFFDNLGNVKIYLFEDQNQNRCQNTRNVEIRYY